MKTSLAHILLAVMLVASAALAAQGLFAPPFEFDNFKRACGL